MKKICKYTTIVLCAIFVIFHIYTALFGVISKDVYKRQALCGVGGAGQRQGQSLGNQYVSCQRQPHRRADEPGPVRGRRRQAQSGIFPRLAENPSAGRTGIRL